MIKRPSDVRLSYTFALADTLPTIKAEKTLGGYYRVQEQVVIYAHPVDLHGVHPVEKLTLLPGALFHATDSLSYSWAKEGHYLHVSASEDTMKWG